MSELGTPFPGHDPAVERIGPRAHAVIWLTTTLAFSLLPFGLLPLVYHAFHDPPAWPDVYDLFGGGDIALVVVAVLGATVAELVQVSRARLVLRAVLIASSVVSGMISVAIYAIAKYQLLAKGSPDTVVNTYTLISLLAFSVLVQCFLILRRRTGTVS